MNKWWLLISLSLCVACTPIGGQSKADDTSQSPAIVVDTKQYTVRQQLSSANEGKESPEKQNLWVALIQDFPPYQEVLEIKVSPNKYTLFTDEFGNQYAEFDFSDHPPGTIISVEIEYQVAVNEIIYELGTCRGELPDEFTQPELHIESANPQIVSLANELSKGQKTPCTQVRAFYDYVGDEFFYSFNRNSWGAQATFGLMGADCTEYASMVAALSRAEGIPTRYYEGLLFLEDKEEAIAQTEHAWLDVYLPESGWVGMDPTLGRWPIYRDTYFAHYTPDHIIVTTGRNPSTLRGASYWSHLYWPGDATTIRVSSAEWEIAPTDQ
jgi:transglutaminase-like putative cysteine protease